MESSTKRPSFIKLVVFSLTPLMILLLVAEIGIRAVYFNLRSQHKLALMSTWDYLTHRIRVWRAQGIGIQMPGLDALFSESGSQMLAALEEEYEQHFAELVEEVRAIDSELLVLFIPFRDYRNSIILEKSESFYSSLTTQYQVEFLSLTEDFRNYDVESVTLMPEDAHLSRFGHKVTAKVVGPFVEKTYGDYGSSHRFESRPRLLGDLKPNQDLTWYMKPRMPYHVVTNSQGLRMDFDLEFPKSKQRILILGDSYTFGPYLPNDHTYPYLLSQAYPRREFVNAGIAAYTITDEKSLFQERAKYVEPDITILQVLENDVYGLLSVMKNRFDRDRRTYEPSEVEKEFLSLFAPNP